MARLFRFCIALTAVLLLVEFAVAVDPPELSPAPAPESGAEDVAPSPHTLSPPLSPTAPSPSPYFGSPPAPPLALESSPSPSPDSSPAPTPSPTPSSSDVGDIQHTSTENADGEEGESSGGLKGGQKAGIALGVIACVAVLGVGCLVYKKRQDNIQRSRYGYAARRELL